MRAFSLVLLLAALLPAEDWVIQNQTKTVTIPTVHEGNIVVLDGGVLDIHAPFTQTGFIGVFAGGLLKIHGCNFRLQSAYNGQFFLAALETGRIEIDTIRFSSNGWQAGIIALDDGVVTITGSDFFLDPAGTTQPGMYGRGRITLEDSRGDFEVILLDQGRFEGRRIPPATEDPLRTRLWVWPTFGDGDAAVLTYPEPGVQDFEFPGPNSHTAFSYLLEDVNIPFWPLLVKPGSQVTLLSNPEDRHLIVGHLLYKDAVLSIRNHTDYADFLLPLADRSFRVVDSRVQTWNLYPYEDARLVVRGSVLGEILGSDASETWVFDSTIDGSGGFLGVNGTASITLVDSTVTTMVQSVEQGSIDFIRSEFQPHPGGIPSYLTLAGEGRAWLMDTPAPQYLLPNGAHCVPRTSLEADGGRLTTAFARTCPAGIQEDFERVEVMVEDDGSERAAILYSAAVQQPGTIGMNLPSWCQSPCACRARLSFEFGGAPRSYSEIICADAAHGRPAERPKGRQGWFSGFSK